MKTQAQKNRYYNRIAKSHSTDDPHCKPVVRYAVTKNGTKGRKIRTYPSVTAARVDVQNDNVTNALNGRYKTCANSIWEYATSTSRTTTRKASRKQNRRSFGSLLKDLLNVLAKHGVNL